MSAHPTVDESAGAVRPSANSEALYLVTRSPRGIKGGHLRTLACFVSAGSKAAARRIGGEKLKVDTDPYDSDWKRAEARLAVAGEEFYL